MRRIKAFILGMREFRMSFTTHTAATWTRITRTTSAVNGHIV